jgi:hypothetical protein
MANRKPSRTGLRYKKTAGETPAGQKRVAKYHAALGHFVATFARAEVAVQTVLRFYAGLPANRAHILFSGTRADAGIDLIKKLAAEQGMGKTDKEILSETLAHLRDINTTRNAILHYGAQGIAEDAGFVEKALYGVDATKVAVTRLSVSTEDLISMQQDLQIICMILYVGFAGRPALKGGGFTREGLLNLWRGTWRYKPPQPLQSQSKNQEDQQSAKRPATRPRQQPTSGGIPVDDER